MRSAFFLGLAACWSASAPPSKAPPTSAPVTAPVAAVAAVEPAARPAVRPAVQPAPAPPPRAYVLPERVKQALATEPLAGNVLVPANVSLFPTEAAARADASKHTPQGAVAMRIVRDRGDVVEVETARVADCVDGFAQPYQLTVFVQRDRLVPRASTDVVKTFSDGTGVAIDRGAPIEIRAQGLAWSNDVPALRPREDQLTYAVPAFTKPAALPALAGDRLICDYGGGGPRTLAEWRADRRAKREQEQRARAEKRRAELEARRAELERKREEAERARKAKAAAKAKASKGKPKTRDELLAEALGKLAEDNIGLIGGSAYDDDVTIFGGLDGTYDLGDERFAPYCTVREPHHLDPSPTARMVPPPTINGAGIPWPSSYRPGASVVQVGARYVADVEYGCGRARMVVDRVGVVSGGGGAGIGGLGGEQKIQVWVPKPGKVTWPDGTPAGTYSGSKRYRTVVEETDRICVHVPDIAERVCHDKRKATTEMVYPSMLRD